MSENYAREILRRNVAQICQTIGWNGINSTPLDILVHVLEKYIRSLGTQANRYAEQFNRTEPNLDDLGLVFRDLNIHLPELSEYTRCVPPIPPPVNVDKFPKPKESNLNFLKPGSHEVVTRPMHVHEHLPPMYPEKEGQTPVVADTVEITQNGHDFNDARPNASCSSPEISVTDSPEKKDIFKRPTDPVSLPNSKRPRLKLDEEDCHTREISSVMMTMSGFLSPAREGKLPEARTPTIIHERHHDRHKPNSHQSNLMKAPTLHSSVDKSEKKSKKSKMVNGKVMKSKKRDKSHKDGKARPEKIDRYPPGFLPKTKEVQPHHNHITMPAPKPLPIPQPVDNITTLIKKEPIDELPSSSRASPRPREPSTIPVPRKIPISKSPLVPNHASTPIPRHPLQPTPSSYPSSTIAELHIKREVVEGEKLSSQPDRSKLNIFKRISNKSKEDKTPEVVTEKPDSISPQSSSKVYNKHSSLVSTEIKLVEPVNNNGESAVDLSKQMDLTTNEVISIDDDSLDLPPPVPTVRKDLFDSPVPVKVPANMNKTKESPVTPGEGVSPKIKKDRKHKEKKDKAAEKAAKMNAKFLKKHQQLAMQMAAHGEKPNLKFPTKPPKLGRPTKEKLSHIPGFPYFNMPPGRGLMPGPGLIPNPGLIPGGDFLSGLANNPALRGLQPHMLANPFALGAGPGLIASTSFMPGTSGLIPPGLPSHMMPNFNQPSRSQPKNVHPLLRRPSLEVIPVDDEDRRLEPQLLSPHREKDRHDKHKASSIPNILQKHNTQKPRISKESPPKPVHKMPIIQPDVTIELNPPTPKHDPIPIPVPVPIPIKREKEPVKVEPEPTPVKVKQEPEPIAESSSTDTSKDKDKTEKKKDKLHKKEKKDKDGLKIKKKKEKKEKSKHKIEKIKEEKDDKEVEKKIKKEKKEKKKDKEKPPHPTDGLVPKLTLKLGSSSPMPPSSPDVYKLNIKPIVKKEESSPVESREESRETSHSPELAQISALVTRPPKQRHSKHNHVSSESDVKTSPNESGSSPTRKSRPSSSSSKYKRILFKPMAKKSHIVDDDSDINSIPEDPPPASTPVEKPLKLNAPYYMDKHGNKVWVCPACGGPDTGSPMIGCDGCDGWYHWICVGITKEPGASEDWFCKSCMAKRAAMVTALAGGVTSGKKRGRKPKMEKVKEH